MGKVRIYELAKNCHLEPKGLVTLCRSLGLLHVKNHMSVLEEEEVRNVQMHLSKSTPSVQAEKNLPSRTAEGHKESSVPHNPVIEHTTGHVAVERIRPTVVKRRAASPVLSETDTAQAVDDRQESHSVPPASFSSPEEVPLDRPVATKIPEPTKEEASPLAPVQAAECEEASVRVLSVETENILPSEKPAAPSVPSRAAGGPPPPPVKTGIEYWTGRPGVPMPPPPVSSGSPRRVQYDTRTPSTGGGVSIGPIRRDVRTGAPSGRHASGNRGGMYGRRIGGPGGRKPEVAVSTKERNEHKKVIRIEGNITLQGMAAKMSFKVTDLLMKVLGLGMTGVHINTTLDSDTAKLLASEFGWEVEDTAETEEQILAAARGEAGIQELQEGGGDSRAPVVTIMGHVDHGKTSLLDRIRKSNVVAGESGGITQHIGAYKVHTPHGPVVFLDTPGHAAFTHMRMRGARVTDIVVLVVAADDGVMPQTKEAIHHAQAAKVPVVVAVNKIDKPGADPERVKRQLVELGLQPEEWGGDTLYISVSAHTGEGIDTLLEQLALQAEVLELRASEQKPAFGTVIEALLDRGRGPVARVLVQDGTLRVGDLVLAGAGFGKIRAMANEHGKPVKSAGPSTPVEVLGLSDVPHAGDLLHVVKDLKKAQEIADARKGKLSRGLIPTTAKISLEEISRRVADGAQKELRVVLKADVQGSVEAISEALVKLSCDKVRLLVVSAGVGAITEGDVNLAVTTQSILVGFHVRSAGKSALLAEEKGVEIRFYSVIYSMIDDIRSAMEGLLPPMLVEQPLGKVEVRQCFGLKGGTIAGSYVLEGEIKRSAKVRVLRDGVVLWDGKIDTLKRFKDDVRSVPEGFECGICLEGFHAMQEKDVIVCYEIKEIRQTL